MTQATPIAIFDLLETRYGSKSALARAVGVSRQAINDWRANARIPAQHCARLVEEAAGSLTLQDLRPDIFPDWAKGAPPRPRR